jgi:hypothetical protein
MHNAGNCRTQQHEDPAAAGKLEEHFAGGLGCADNFGTDRLAKVNWCCAAGAVFTLILNTVLKVAAILYLFPKPGG